MRRIRKMFNGECDHRHTLVVTSAGVRRTVCESCGHVSFKMVETNATAQKVPVDTILRKAAGL